MIELIFIVIFLTLVCGGLSIISTYAGLALGAVFFATLGFVIACAVIYTIASYTCGVIEGTEQSCREKYINIHPEPKQQDNPNPPVQIAINTVDPGRNRDG